MANGEVPMALKVIFPIIYYGLCITIFVFMMMEHNKWNEFGQEYAEAHGAVTAANEAMKMYGNVEYTLVSTGFFLVILDFTISLFMPICNGIGASFFEVNEKTGQMGTVHLVFRKLGVFGAYWAVFQWCAGSHLPLSMVMSEDDDAYLDLVGFLIPPVMGILGVVLPAMEMNEYSLVGGTRGFFN